MEAARNADAVIVVVGTTEYTETEGRDRADLRLGGHQDALVRAVAAANPRTVAVVNSGGPVELPWRDEAGAVLLTWFPGQEAGSGLADMLFGLAEPGGRLPTTWAASLADAPVTRSQPAEGRSTTRRDCTSATARGRAPNPNPPTGSDTARGTRPGSTGRCASRRG
ncbi:glycoside hydrolase family 3 C-terminal domain-containing protein [Streptomyces zhihengii]